MFYSRRKTLSQNFLRSRTLLEKLVRNSSIGKNDTVLDIGAGKGIITESLARSAKNVVAIEIDDTLIPRLMRLKQALPNVQVVNANFLRCPLPQTPYKVFSNIPFSIEGKIIRKLLNAENPPLESFIILRNDFAKRLTARKTTQLSVMYAPWFTFSIIHHFTGSDFTPYARMDTCLLCIERNINPDVSVTYRKEFHAFVKRGFEDGRPVWKNLSVYFSKKELERASSQCQFSPRWTPSRISTKTWIQLFNTMKREKTSGKM